MKIQYLGTAAAEGFPAFFCPCAVCRRARETGGKNVRSRSQALIDGKLDIDFPADAYMHSLVHGIDYTQIHDYLITHIHEDHLYPKEFYHVDPPGSGFVETGALYRLYGSEDLTEAFGELNRKPRHMEIHTLEAYRTQRVGDYDVTPVRGNHGTAHPYNYIISDGEKTLFYVHDSGWPFEETWDYFEKEKPHFDLVSMDCCSGSEEEIDFKQHMCLGDNRRFRAELIRRGYADEKTVFVVNHFSHNGKNVLYDDHEIYEKEGFVMSWDGLTVEF